MYRIPSGLRENARFPLPSENCFPAGQGSVLDLGAIFPHDVGMILELHSPLDMHLHLRDGDMMKLVAPLSSASFTVAARFSNSSSSCTAAAVVICSMQIVSRGKRVAKSR